MKQVLLLLSFFYFNNLRAQQVPRNENVFHIKSKQILPGIFGKAISITSFTNNEDSSTTIFTTLFLSDSSNNGSIENIQQIRRTYKVPSTEFKHFPATKQEIRSRIAEALKI